MILHKVGTEKLTISREKVRKIPQKKLPPVKEEVSSDETDNSKVSAETEENSLDEDASGTKTDASKVSAETEENSPDEDASETDASKVAVETE